jgi:hypothetical protein
MNEKGKWLIIGFALGVSIAFAGAGIFPRSFARGGDLQRPARPGSTNNELERELAECRIELERERQITERIGGAIATARDDIKNALNAGGRAETSIQALIVQMARLVDCLRRIDSNLSNALDY